MTSRKRFEGFLSHSPIGGVPVDLVAQGRLREWEKYRHDERTCPGMGCFSEENIRVLIDCASRYGSYAGTHYARG